MENRIDNIEKKLLEIEKRNKRVEENKAWEVSNARKVGIASLTYIVISIFFVMNKNPEPFISALVPTCGFLLSTLSLSLLKKFWLKNHHR